MKIRRLSVSGLLSRAAISTAPMPPNFHPGKFAVEFRSGITENRFTPAGCNLEASLRGNQLNLAGFRGEPAFFQINEPCRDNIACRHSRQHI